MTGLFFQSVGIIIIPIDEFIFFRGVGNHQPDDDGTNRNGYPLVRTERFGARIFVFPTNNNYELLGVSQPSIRNDDLPKWWYHEMD